MKRTNLPKRAFTLIELLVVVTIIGVLASLAMPAMMKVSDKRLVKAAHLERMQEAQDYKEENHTGKKTLPVIDHYSAQLDLSSDYQRVGLEVYSRYQLTGSGVIRFRGGTKVDESVSLSIPFPAGTIEASNVSLTFVDPETGETTEPDSVVYHQSGIQWTGKLERAEAIEANFTYTTLGTEVAEIELPPARRISNVELLLDLENSSATGVTSYSLIPTTQDGSLYTWKFGNIVSDRNIVVKIPGAESPGGRLLTLMRFVAAAVFLFGAGFLYMNESYAPGRLDEFRIGHFSLLALTYLLFFIIFGVVIYREHLAVAPALVIAAVCSLPLLVLHVARITDLRFAMRHILPMAVGTLALVINGVFGGQFRDYGFLLLLIAVTAYLTLTYRPQNRHETVVPAT